VILETLIAESRPRYQQWCEARECCDAEWEAAYERFETPAEEIRKFTKRLQTLGVRDWPTSHRIVELCCGRGNGLVALEQLGFANLEGVDLAGSLLAKYQGSGQLYQGDCRDLKFPDESKDVFIVQGGLHHLPKLPDDLDRTLAEIHRVLVPTGIVVIVEPWLTTFLKLVHFASKRSWLRRLVPKVDALQTMIEREQTTYDQWLARPGQVLSLLDTHFTTRISTIGWGKLMYVGVKK
jgi:ubiquinone/menaquinone biosynthesis C-methylase UbiE